MWVAGAEVLGSSPTASQGKHEQEAGIGSGAGTLVWDMGIPTAWPKAGLHG